MANEPIIVQNFDQIPTIAEDTWMQVEYDDKTYKIQIRKLSIYEWMSFEHAIPFPEVPMIRSISGETPNYRDPKYQLDRVKRNDQINARRMASCIRAEISGHSISEKADYLIKHYPMGLLQAIFTALDRIHQEGEADIVNRSERFLDGGEAPPEDDD